MENLYRDNCNCIVQIEKMIVAYRRQDYYSANMQEKEVLTLLTHLFSEMCNAGILEADVVNEMLMPLLSAKEQQDYVLLADLYDLQVTPFLMEIQERLRGQKLPDYWRKNMEILTDAYLKEQLTFPEGEKSEICYFIEETSIGAKTLRAQKNEKTWYLHSNKNPWDEGRIFADEYYDIQQTEYLMLGFGLGYHVEQLRKKSSYCTITVFEPSLKALQLAFEHSDLTEMLASGQIKIIYDPMLKELGNHLKDFAGVFVIHAPSMRCIENPQIREQFEEYFVQLASVKAQGAWLYQNFNQNVKVLNKVVDELKDKWRGEEVLLVAGGPSLDENIMKIKEFRKGRILLAVGTVVKKLLQEGVKPDYMIITDAKEEMTKQIEGVKTDDIPLLYLSTVSPKVLRAHTGEQYCILQNGFRSAEQYAQTASFDLYETGGSVSTTALDIAIRLAQSTVYCFGLDLAYTGAKTHAEGTADYKEVDVSGYRQVRSVEGGMVPTIKNLDSYRHWIERRIESEKAMKFINISRGAYIHGMENRASLEGK